MERRKLPSGNTFEATKKIGQGNFGKVYLGRILLTNEKVAIKEINLTKSQEDKKKVLRELQVMEKIKHQNCVNLFSIEPENYQDADLIYVVMEYCDLGDLNEYLELKKDKNEKLSIEEVTEIFGQIVLGLRFLYEKGIVHRDLKPENILLQSNDDSTFGYRIKLADFGFAREIPKDDYGESIKMNSFIGTPLYVAPEILLNKPYTSNVDFWSLGAILYELITGFLPIQATSIKNLKKQYKYLAKKSLPKAYLNKLQPECNDLVERLLTVDPKLRISKEQLYNHPFIIEKLKELKEKSIEIQDLEKKIIGITKKDYKSKENDKLSFKKGEIIEIIKINKDEGICEGKLKEKEGIIELNRIDLYEEIKDIFSLIESNSNIDNNQIKKFQKRIIGIVSNNYKSKQFSLPKGNLVKIIKINEENDSCEIQFGNQKEEIPFFFLDFYEQIGENDENENEKEKEKSKSKSKSKLKSKSKSKSKLKHHSKHGKKDGKKDGKKHEKDEKDGKR
ncbi:serine/threonine-protein kinase [Anaeramoeba ignava]|uniref:Serine/threonine-protein kinase n=1 Tax=Anaeramoeba ignava TaxID=1746090 RepID=A0A9Q0LNQ7_ANAIG|nr:serine/threonine-protein kinase [Anaeramoeba ignava]